MCNAWNHSFYCDCGWGGSGTSSRGWKTSSFYSLTQVVSFSAAISEAQTYATECWWCGESVYYHTNGFGDSVLFDKLGYPWEIHICWELYWSEAKKKKNSSTLASQLKPTILGKDLDPDEIKYIVLKGAFEYLKNHKKDVTEEAVSTQLGITPQQLYEFYKDIYEVYVENKVLKLRLRRPKTGRF